MFSFARTVIDLIQSATGLKVKPSSIRGDGNEHEQFEPDPQKQPKKNISPVLRTPHTSIENALNTFKQSIVVAQSLKAGSLSTTLIEEDFVFALQGYCANFTLRNGQEVLIRPILPVDVVRMREGFVLERLLQIVLASGEISQHSLTLRFNTITTDVKEYMLKYFTNINYDTHFAVTAMIREEGSWKGVATARFIEDTEQTDTAEWAAIVLDKYHGLGIGSCLLYYISYFAAQCDIRKLCAIVHPDNYPVLHWMKKLNAYQLLYHDCRYWFYETPIFPSWVFDDQARLAIERGANGETTLNEECLEILRQSVRDLIRPVYLQNVQQTHKTTVMASKKSRSVPNVTFVTSHEDELDIGELF